jgi:hypothetical protein
LRPEKTQQARTSKALSQGLCLLTSPPISL